MNKKPIAQIIFLSLLLAMGFLFTKNTHATIDVTNGMTTLDYGTTQQNATNPFGVTSGGTEYEFWAYTPGASHNICSINFILKAHGTPLDAVALQVRLASSTPNLSGSPLLFGTLVRNADAAYQVRDTTFTIIPYTFTPCLIVSGASHYNFILYRDGSFDNSNYYEAARTNSNNGKWISQFGTAIIEMYEYGISGLQVTGFQGASYIEPSDIAFFGTENYNATTPTITAATSTTITDLSGSITWCDQRFPSDGLSAITNGLCKVFGFLFIPSTSVVDQFKGIPDYLFTKAPLSYVQDGLNLVRELTGTSTPSVISTIVISTSTTIGPPFSTATTTLNTPISFELSKIVQNFPLVTQIRNLFGYIIYVVWGFQVVTLFINVL